MLKICEMHLRKGLWRYQWQLLHTNVSGQKIDYFITTPIFYVNAAPHLGHLYSAVLADALHRFHRMLGAKNTIFSTGTDEHGLKIQQAAACRGESEKSHCDTFSSKFRDLFSLANIQSTDFLRTTEDRHLKAVKSFWQTLVQTGDIYQGVYEGWYCTAEESFLSETDLKQVRDNSGNVVKVSAETGHPVEWTSESNYMFKLSKYQPDVLSWLKNPDVVKPGKFQDILRRTVEESCQDLSVSRSRSRLHWGIAVPGDETQTIYVWLDALVNYLTVAGYPEETFSWPPHAQVIGKDILKFHGFYWPAFLIAAGLEPPRHLLCHSHWMVDHAKMSKSKGNVIDPFQTIHGTSVDAVRYFLLREGVPHSDGNYSTQKFANLVNAELADTFGNLLNRCTAKSLNPQQIYPRYNGEAFSRYRGQEGDELLDLVMALPDIVEKHYSDFNFYKGIEQIMTCLRQANLFVQVSKPWDLKGSSHKDHLETVIYITFETLRVCSLLLMPVIPTLCTKLLNRLGVQQEMRMWKDLRPFASRTKPGANPSEGQPLGPSAGVLFQKTKDDSLPGVKNIDN